MSARQHGTRTKYVHDRCRCEPCCDANRRYARANREDHALGLSGFVDAAPARAHLLKLRELGIGTRAVAELSGVSRSALRELLEGKRCRAEVAAAVRQVPLTSSVAPGSLVDAAATWQRVAELLVLGHSKAWISAQIGQGGRALQLGRDYVTQRNAAAIFRLWVQERDHIGVWE